MIKKNNKANQYLYLYSPRQRNLDIVNSVIKHLHEVIIKTE